MGSSRHPHRIRGSEFCLRRSVIATPHLFGIAENLRGRRGRRRRRYLIGGALVRCRKAEQMAALAVVAFTLGGLGELMRVAGKFVCAKVYECVTNRASRLKP
jgi:hypothetical protein